VAAVAGGHVVGLLAVTIWLAGTVAGAGVLLVGLARLRWLRASSSLVTDGPWHRLCADLARSCGLRRGVDLLFGPRPGLVATWGWRRPAVMLPAAASEWSAERMRVVLLHELAHVRHCDWLLQMAAEALRCVWWFNPLAWVVRARLRRESEHAADDLVLARGVPATTCATHLVELAKEARKHRRTWLPAPAMARPSHLERRLSAMLNSHANRRPMTRRARFWSLGALVPAAMLVAGLQVGAQTARISGTVVDQDGNVVRNPEVTFTIREAWQSAGPMRYAFVDQAGNVVRNPDITRISTTRSASAQLIGRDDGSFEVFDLGPGEYILAVRTPGFEPLFRQFSLEAGEQREEELVLSRMPAGRQPLTGAESATTGTAPATTGRPPESIGSAVGQEPPPEPSSERIAELVERAAALQEQLQSVLDELQSVLGDPDQPAGRSDEPVRIGDGVPPPAKIHDVPPVYPPAAREAGVQGLVILEATIDPTGEVGNVEVLRSVPELEEAAIAAVEQWRYEPTLVDGAPVSVLMTVTINFLLPSP
jgi:TonB family protein